MLLNFYKNGLPPYFSRNEPVVYSLVAIAFPVLYIVLQIFWPQIPILVWQTLCFAAPSIWFCRWANLQRAFVKSDFWRKLIVVLLLSILISLTMNGLAEIWEEYFPLPDFMMKAYEGLFHTQAPFGFCFDLLQIAIVPAMAEEFLFRGVILTGLLKKFSPLVAVLLNALLFATYHLDPWHLPFLFALGLFFATIYVKTNNLWLAMVSHFINNAIGVIYYYQAGHL